MDGLLVLNKPSGWTSHDVVARVRGILKEDRIGHLGTLDPMARGVLPLAVGAANRLVEFASFDKEYLAVCLLGRTTDSCDVTGRTTSERPVEGPIAGRVREELSKLAALTQQVPPMVSAVKQDGRKLYELARKGITVERKARPIRIEELELTALELPRVNFRVVCSAGTYVRVLCQDLGEGLGTGGCLQDLERTRVGPFLLKDALTLEALQEAFAAGALEPRPPSLLVQDLPTVRLDASQVRDLEQGRSLFGPTGEGLMQARNPSGRLCAVVEATLKGLRPKKVFVKEGLL